MCSRLFTFPPNSRARDERGAILILTALVMIILLLIAALATDLGAWYRQGQEQQRAADVASLNGVQAHDLRIKAYLEDKGESRLTSLTTAEQTEAEELAMQEAVDAVIGALAAGGMNITDVPVITTALPPAESTATVTAVDGTVIVITRTASNAITVNVGRAGEQYFSNFVRDAPEIVREGSAIISNCNADCDREIEIKPPFSGFDARGDGDGWAPLLRGDTEIWAVNHHSFVGPWRGSVVCMDRATKDFCNFNYPGAAKPGSISLEGYRTHTRGTDYLDEGRNKLYFTARDISASQTGVICVDLNARDYCTNEFVALWPFTRTSDTNAVGPVMWNDNLYVVAQDGRIACVDPDTMTTCGEWTMAANSHPSIPDIDNNGKTNNMELHGDKLYVTMALNNGEVLFECWNFQSASSCWTNTASQMSSGSDRFTFFAFDASGNPTHICNARKNGRNACAALTNGAIHENTALRNYLPALNVSWIGDTFAVLSGGEVRTVFGGGAANVTVCFDWKTNSGCGVVDHPQYTAATLPSEPDGAGRWPSVGGNAIEPYAYSQVTEDCILGLGDESNFFTLTVDTMETCTGSTVSTFITPCLCSDDTLRYGNIELPDEMLAVLNSANATITGGGITVTGNLMDGPFELRAFDGVPGPIELIIDVDSKINDDGTLAWTEPYNAAYGLTVQPTLTRD